MPPFFLPGIQDRGRDPELMITAYKMHKAASTPAKAASK